MISLRTQRSRRFKHRRFRMQDRAFVWGLARHADAHWDAAVASARADHPQANARQYARRTAASRIHRAEVRDKRRAVIAASLFLPAPRCSICGDRLDDSFHALLSTNPRLRRIH
jgi:hypothetical protein